MKEKVKYLNTDFTTAVGVKPVITFKPETLFVQFPDWRNENIRMVFENVVAFKWQEINTHTTDEQSDCCYLVENSSWLEEYIAQGRIPDRGKYNHYKFCFNTAGILEVIASSMRTEIQVM